MWLSLRPKICFFEVELWRDIPVASGLLRNFMSCLKYRSTIVLEAILWRSYWFHVSCQPRFLEDFPDLLLRWCSERINVYLNWAFEKERSLRDNWYVLSQWMQTHFQSVVISDFIDCAQLRLEDPKQCLDDRGFACSSSSYYSNFLALLSSEANLVQNQR